jgi:hypothetical protein
VRSNWKDTYRLRFAVAPGCLKWSVPLMFTYIFKINTYLNV